MRERYLYYRKFLWEDTKYYLRWHWEYLASIAIFSTLALAYNYYHKINKPQPMPNGINDVQRKRLW